MPDGTPSQQKAIDDMRQWLAQHRPVIPVFDPLGGGAAFMGRPLCRLTDMIGVR